MIYYVDLDGTVADAERRIVWLKDQNLQSVERWARFFAPELVSQDKVLPEAAKTLDKILASGQKIVFITGRPESLREITEKWLTRHFSHFNPYNHEIIMRPQGDFTPAGQWKAAVIGLRGETAFTLIDDELSVREAIAKHFPEATVLSAPEGWTQIEQQLTYNEPGGMEQSADTSITVDQDGRSAEDYSDMD